MISAYLWNTLRFGSSEDWQQFVATNLADHDEIAQAIVTGQGSEYPRVPFLTQSVADQQAHLMEHQAIARILGLPVPSINELTFDPDQEDDFYSFLSYHINVHQAARAAAGLIA